MSGCEGVRELNTGRLRFRADRPTADHGRELTRGLEVRTARIEVVKRV